MKKRVYLSGPMSYLPDYNVPEFNKEAKRLRDLGYEVVNPAELNQETWTSWNDCMKIDLKAMLECDAIAMLDGWERSKGAHLELHVAHRVGMEIVIAKELGA